MIFDKNRLFLKINRYFISRLGGVIVVGRSHMDIFDGLISANKIHIVPNFSEDHLFTTEEKIRSKFADIKPLKMLFLSNFVQGKGFDVIIDTFADLDINLKRRISIDFAGAFDSEAQKAAFLDRIAGVSQIRYRGIVKGEEKKELLSRAHILCLPTCLNEGQPISILEAYASGCVVITTDQGGIRDVFRHNVNGFEVDVKSTRSLKAAFERCIINTHDLMPIALSNTIIACNRYRVSNYLLSLMNIVNSLLKTDNIVLSMTNNA